MRAWEGLAFFASVIICLSLATNPSRPGAAFEAPYQESRWPAGLDPAAPARSKDDLESTIGAVSWSEWSFWKYCFPLVP